MPPGLTRPRAHLWAYHHMLRLITKYSLRLAYLRFCALQLALGSPFLSAFIRRALTYRSSLWDKYRKVLALLHRFTVPYHQFEELSRKIWKYLFTLFSNNKRLYYKKHVSFFNVLCNTNNYSWEEIILLKDFILFLQKNKVNYNDIMNYFKHKYYNYYLKFLVTTVVKNNVKTN